jgi:hypothetical protein
MFVSQCESNNVQHECFLGTINSDRWNIAAVWGDAGDTIGEAEANAHLIAAAPELLAALEICWNSLKTYGNHPLIKMKVEAAIDKATGKKERVQ